MENEFETSLANSAWSKRIARQERRKEFLLRAGDALGVAALFAFAIVSFYLIAGFGS